MEKYERIAVLDDEVEAEIVDSQLSQLDIPHIMVCYHDTILDGIFQGMKGWGHVEAPVDYRDQILTVIKDLKT
ncbi:MAG TPA: hypothetical protein P5186_27875 [Candidatus Paceibacterota bacterium]|nr:hypothetical protein [Verrucomicrobiota bacterium]HRY51871.1 hypothetical protein [Candidatus Paceibacterota bacterium]HSA00309.1 hypothetical protein [Candidatus Paceibacterota bacterium]